MVTESGEQFQTLFDEKRLYKLLSVQEQKDGTFIFRAKPIFEEKKGITEEEQEKARKEELRQITKERLEEDLQLDGYILLGWYRGHPAGKCHLIWENDKKYGQISERGKAAYLPIAGARWVYIWNTHARYAPHPNPVWCNKKYTDFAETDKKPMRKSPKEMLKLFSLPKQEPYGAMLMNAWIPSVPLWLLDNEKDMRPLYLAGGKPE